MLTIATGKAQPPRICPNDNTNVWYGSFYTALSWFGDNPRALASELSPVYMNNHGIPIFNFAYISVDIAHYETGISRNSW